MSENSTNKEYTTYDFTKNIKEIEINPSFIIGLQNITSKFMLNASEKDQLKIPDAIKKFKLIMDHNSKSDTPIPDIELDAYEQNLYVLFALVNYLKFEAERQGLTIKKEIEINNDLFKNAEELLKNGITNDNLIEQLTELSNKFIGLKDKLNDTADNKILS